MDSRISVQKNNPVPLSSVAVSDVPDSGVPANSAEQDLPSKITKACSGIASKLNKSSAPMIFPDKTRTVSSTESLLARISHSFDFRFVTSDDEVRQLLVARTGDGNRDVTLISHPDDLSQANLVSRLSISEEGRNVLRSGKLFEGSKPLTLVMDIRKLTSEELPKFNDLLDPDNPCLYDKVSQNKRSLGEHVDLLVLANPEQLASVGRAVDAPGADFWRRINRPGNTWQFDAQTSDDSSMEVNEVPPVLAELSSDESTMESAMDDDNTILIDCHLHSNWRQLLLGGPGVDKQGRIQHLPGKLETLRAGQRVILKGANWQDLAFEQTIRQMLAQKSFESNGKLRQLPDDVQFYQMPVGKDELHSLFQSLSHPLSQPVNAPENPIIINQSNISGWLNPIAIAPEGHAVPNNCLLEQVRAGGVVTVTSPLTEALWFCLLGSLQTIRKTTGLEPRLRVAHTKGHTKGQPKALGLTKSHEHSIKGHAAFNTVTYQQSAQASHWINDQKTPLVIQVNEQTSLSQLFDNIHITSVQKAHFGRCPSELQEALTSGKPVVLRGLESNPDLQQLLEPLIIGQPLLVNGQLQAYPKAQVTVLWPESAKSPSAVFSSMIAMGKPCPEIDIWDINTDKHGIRRAELPEKELHQLYEAFKTVPPDLCNPLPKMTEGLLNNLILAARRAQQVDQSPQLLPSHWRKAINSVITHGTRQNSSVRDFIKVACWQLLPDAFKNPDAYKKPDENQTASVDPDRLNAIINGAPQLDRKFVTQNLWSLARAFDPAGLQLSYKCPLPPFARKQTLNRLCATIVAHTPESQRDAIAYQLEVDPAAAAQYQSLAIRPSRQIKRLQDALASGWQLSLLPGQTRSDAIEALAADCFHIARGEYVTENSDAERIERIGRIENRLSESLEWQGSADQPLSALAQDLYHGSMNQKDRESRRLSRLHDRLADSPVLFLQGETGTGKSYFSARMAEASGEASVISLGPSDTEQTLMKRWQWQEHADGDRAMELQNRTLMEWARTSHDKDGEYVTLILDEANLAKTGLLASLNGLWEAKPCIYVNGHPVKVSKKHRVILTGNPDYYAGRQLDPTLKEKLPRAYYPRLDQAFLRDRVVETALVNQLQRHLPDHQINTVAKSATESVMALWQYYQELLPEHEFTPRDLTDICSWVGWYLDCAPPLNDSVTGRQINGLIQQSFRDVLGPEISETHQDALTALEIWFAARYEPDNSLSNKVRNKTLSDIQQAFITVTEKNRPDFDTSGSAVHELVQRLGQDLSRCQLAYHLDRKHDGRQATLIEGPAGRGKDATLNLVIESVKRQAVQQEEYMPEVFLLNACDCSWNKVCEKIRTAKVHGGIVVISEMNLIDSQHLEGELNDILAGDAHPGFHLFATVNPMEYCGRKPLSPALKGRFRHLPIRQYSPAELQTIAEKVLPQTPQGKTVAEKLTQLHCRLRAELQRKKLPLQPTSLDLQNAARAVIRGGDFTEDGLHQCLNQHYRLYLMAAGISLAALPKSSALVMGNSKPDSGLSNWFNQTVSDIDRPWLIRRSDLNSVDEKRHEISIKTRLSDEEAKTEMIKMVAQARWLAFDLPLKPDQSDDIFTRALYRCWQQSWFNRKFGQTGVDAKRLFPMTEEEKQTLKIPANQPYLREVDKRIAAWEAAWDAHAVQRRPAFWHQIRNLPNHWVDDSEKYSPHVHEKQAPALDRKTDYERLKIPKKNSCQIFNTQNHPPAMYRWSAKDIYVTAKGDIKEIALDAKPILGVESLIPDRLPGRDKEVTLASDQTLATFKASSDNGQYALPSLTPDDYIVALRIEDLTWSSRAMSFFRQPVEPGFTLVRDRYTGLHTLSIPEAKGEQNIEVTYIVEPRKPDEKTPAKGARPERSTWFDAVCSEGMKTVLNKVFETIEEHPTKLRGLLQAIRDAKDSEQRINAITDYCRAFSGDAKPKRGENFFQFLVTRLKGSCRHRVPVFIAMCRYFGIPSRQIDSSSHSFAEYSGDGGHTWESVDLGGAPVREKEITPKFQPTRKVSASSTETRMIKNHLKGADSGQQQALAEASGINLRKLDKALEAGSVLPTINPGTYETVLKLWKRKDLTGFLMGVSMIESLETKALIHELSDLAGDIGIGNKPMSEAVKKILSSNDENQVTQPLKVLHSKMIFHGDASSEDWLNSMVYILAWSDLAKSSVIQFALEALKSGWLDPVPVRSFETEGKVEHHKLLLRLEDVDELKVEAARCLKMWYTTYLSREKNSQRWLYTYKGFQERADYALFITHCHDGFSSRLEYNMVDSSMQTAWTDEPEGIPNIERMLLRQPAFSQLIPGKANHRPVIILGQPSWHITTIDEKAEALYQRLLEHSSDLNKQSLEKIKRYDAVVNQRENALKALAREYSDVATSGWKNKTRKDQYEEERFDIQKRYRDICKSSKPPYDELHFSDDLRKKCKQAIKQAFSHYMYKVTHSKGGCLTYCWAGAKVGPKDNIGKYCGAHDPSSPEELYAMMSAVVSSFNFINNSKDNYLRQALNASNALVLKLDELTNIAEEFVSSVDLDSIYESLV